MSTAWTDRIRADLDLLREQGQFKTLRNLLKPMGPESEIEGVGRVVVLCSNDYLGLASHPEVVATAHAAVTQWGAGTGSVRFICGTFDYHRQIESALAELSATDAATTYVSCWNANEAVIPTLMAIGGGDVVAISDELNHASIIDAVRLGRQINKQSESRIYKHSDMDELEKALRASAGKKLRIVITDGVFSMEGDIAHLDRIHALCREHDALLIVDDSHGVGVVGKTGRGVIEHYGLLGKIDVLTGTLGKALGGAAGGYVAAERGLIELMVQRSRPQLFSNALPPATAGGAMKAIEILRRDTTRVDKLRANVEYIRGGLAKLGFETVTGPSAITPIILGATARAIAASKRLLELGVFVIGFGYPVVPEGKARLRVQISAGHEREHLDRALDAFRKL
ncbi:MAG: aminotransferase class I/II-fold pyridoxal phosphate-dependent enzyme [Phycisphaerae bacterium]|nr:aminotransferase class I/II-fold pyridoxal phosphate-dependent enzyme [Phycisphaerae bacterium]NUQ47156.1 aminotransferase class I/II-fold pyridoxal phosphate-dependent enzyme [Phycisphaerae bacterium]